MLGRFSWRTSSMRRSWLSCQVFLAHQLGVWMGILPGDIQGLLVPRFVSSLVLCGSLLLSVSFVLCAFAWLRLQFEAFCLDCSV